MCHFPIGILGLVWYLIVSISDLCTLTYYDKKESDTYHYDDVARSDIPKGSKDHTIIVRAQSKAISSRFLQEIISKLERACGFTSDLSTLWPPIDILNSFVIAFPLNSLVNCLQNQPKEFVIGLVMKSQFQFSSEVKYGFM